MDWDKDVKELVDSMSLPEEVKSLLIRGAERKARLSNREQVSFEDVDEIRKVILRSSQRELDRSWGSRLLRKWWQRILE